MPDDNGLQLHLYLGVVRERSGALQEAHLCLVGLNTAIYEVSASSKQHFPSPSLNHKSSASLFSHIASAIVESTCFAFPLFRSLCFCPGDLFVELWFIQCTSVVGTERHQDLFLKVPTIGFSSENNPPMLRTWLLGKETLVRTRWPCLCRTAGL